ncbi:MAG TPA: ARMT1-like domain-containing protein, partial [Victivallales bacterium]|nr:ARMT1-like domain-containing protein [Victivallales bacterium]
MRSSLECLPCFLNHSLAVADICRFSREQKELIAKKTLAKLADLDFSIPPPAMAKVIQGFISDITGIKDPYLKLKKDSTTFALKLFPLLKEEVSLSEDSFETSVRLAIAGNIIDFGVNHNFKLEDVHKVITDSLSAEIDKHQVKKLKEKIESSNKILYIADNAGEIVFDRLLLENFTNKFILAVRGFPILNDATRYEASLSELPEGLKIIDTGDNVPGIILSNCSKNFVEIFNNCDFIISKGQGNFETLDETRKPIFFLFKAKCDVVARKLNVQKGALQIISKN